MSNDLWPLIGAPLLMLVGLAGGALASGLGVGASLLFVPALLLVLPQLGVAAQQLPAVAVATSLAASCTAMILSAGVHLRLGNVQRPTAPAKRGALLAAAIGGLAGGLFIVRTPGTVVMLALVLGQVLIAALLASRTRSVGRSVLGKPVTPPSAHAHDDQLLAEPRTRAYLLLVAGLTSIGAGGVFLVPYFLWRGLQRAQAVGLASLLGVVIAPAATIVFIAHRPSLAPLGTAGFVHVAAAVALALGAYLGTRIGAGMAMRIDPVLWTRLLAIMLVASSARAVAGIL